MFTSQLPQMAQLRIDIFREYPYLYDGDFAYESKYLGRYLRCPQSFIGLILAEDGTTLLGMTTAMPLALEDPAFQEPFKARHVPLEQVCYFGELILRPEVRGLGLGNHLMEWNLQFARTNPQFTMAALACVDRSDMPNVVPIRHRAMDAFWHKFGFTEFKDVTCRYAWKDLGASAETEKTMIFWLSPIHR